MNVLTDIQIQIQLLICLDVFEVPSSILCIFNLHVFLEEAFPWFDRRGAWRGQGFLVTCQGHTAGGVPCLQMWFFLQLSQLSAHPVTYKKNSLYLMLSSVLKYIPFR